MKKKRSLYLLLLPLFAFLHLNNDLFGFITFTQTGFFLLYSYCLAGIIYAIAYLFIKRPPVCALIAFCALLFTLFFGPFHDLLKAVTSGNVLSSYKVVIPASVLAFALLVYWFAKKPDKLNKFTQYLNTLLIVLVAIESVKATINIVKITKSNNLIYSETPINDQYISPNIPDSLKPDIYFIVFDGYTNNTTLKKIWNFNNDSITNWLQDKGFYIAGESRANYDFTSFSVSSTFNMNYISVEDNMQISASQVLQSVKSISNNETFSLLQKENYSIHFLAPFESPFEKAGLLHEFGDFAIKKLYNHTLPKRIKTDILWNFRPLLSGGKNPEADPSAYNNYEKRVADVYQIIKGIQSTTNPDSARKPQFVYGHFMITHQPHLFYANGATRPSQEILTFDNLFDTYTNQVIYANKIIQQLVEHIQKNNKRNTVIIIEGDHGFREITGPDLSYNFPNFNAIYFSGSNYAPFYQTMSPVNTFRVFFNQYFKQTLPLLKDTTISIKQK